jgi:hypothetical protein
MSKKTNTADALAGILKAKRGDDRPALPAADSAPATVPEIPPPPSPALPSVAAPADAEKPPAARKRKRPIGKYRDPDFDQCSIWMRKKTRRDAGRRLEDMDSDMDFSDLVEKLVQQWLKSTT